MNHFFLGNESFILDQDEMINLPGNMNQFPGNTNHPFPGNNSFILETVSRDPGKMNDPLEIHTCMTHFLEI